ncbi:MAG: MBL fold metallo-hydrolase [Anaerolineaceae bacterium]|nr:MBL fold metallo-hydrolase [Anaerolineaceae bacterium]
MQIERISENVYWFQSEIYAQVTAGVVAGSQWAVLIDTLAMPEETLEFRRYIEEELNIPVRYIINTHHHADHSWGNCFFPGTITISHALCRKEMIQRGIPSLEAAAEHDAQFKQTKLIPAHMSFFDGRINLKVGKKHLSIFPTPGHSADGVSVFIEEDRILFAGDAFLPIPFIVDGDIHEMRQTLKDMGELNPENIIQGHGDIILRGEVQEAVEKNLKYLNLIEQKVKNAISEGKRIEDLQEITVEDCGKSRIDLNGLAEQLHQSNLRFLYNKLKV